jgi:hypothetical protein
MYIHFFPLIIVGEIKLELFNRKAMVSVNQEITIIPASCMLGITTFAIFFFFLSKSPDEIVS